MKKLVLTAAFTFIGMIAVSAQTTPQNQTRETSSQTPTQTQPNTQATSNWETSSETTKSQNQNTATTNNTAPASVSSDTTESLRADVNGEGTKPADATKEDKKAKKKKSR